MWKEKFILRQKAAEEVAASVRAPGQEAFKTPDLTQPGEEVSVDSQTQFGGDIDWEKDLDDSNDEKLAATDTAAASVKESEIAPDDDAASTEDVTPEPLEDALVAPLDTPAAISDEEAAAAVATEEDDFQPQPLSDLDDTVSEIDADGKKAYETSKAGALSELTERYQLTEEETDKFLTDPGSVVPGMVARVYVDVFESVVGAVNQMLPVSMARVQTEVTQASERTNQFYKAWPLLRTVEGEKTVLAIGKTYRAHNQGATPEEFIRDVGIQAAVALKLPIPGVTTAPEIVDDSLPPAGPSGAAGSAASVVKNDGSQSDNQFERLNAEWDDDDG